MGAVGLLCKGFLTGFSKVETHGMDRFLELLDARENVEERERGLITVSNHISVMDDPILWGILPLSYMFNPDNLRWGLGSYDLCFTNKGLSTFFTFGQVLPTHRSAYSQFGGLFQPTITQAIRLLSRGPFLVTNELPEKPHTSLKSPDLIDPFSGGHLTFSTNGEDTFPAPSAYLSRRHSWVHIFPEGMIHQSEDRIMRYFKWGVSRLILESDPMPDIVPIFIEGFDDIMHETRTFPRFIPRPFKNVRVTFGEKLDVEEVFGDLRARWKQMRAKEEKKGGSLEVGVLNDALKYSDAAVSLRKEVTRRVRQAVLDVRRQRGYPEDDPKNSLASTWLREGSEREGQKEDGSITKDT
ncbi:Lyso-phosphatidylcholine acyltransferase [Neocucurbitaria cava]|uniref:Tafazzin family protein n=1 Tax=Neocucurbitaria cava TaxID=798079 RepID=A0A9W8Y0P7_9PLEO|nr:Lyso-phosphatidylcholine acyltransferase [Neocucurbitaria cava]